MANSVTPALPFSSILLRSGLALLLGLQFFLAVWFDSPSSSWLIWIPVVVLLLALTIAIFLTFRLHSEEKRLSSFVLVLLKVLLSICVPFFLTLVVWLFFPQLMAYLTLIAPLEIGIITALILGNGRVFLSIGVAALAWIGLGLVLITAASGQTHQPGNDLGGLIYALIVVGVIIGIGIAVIGGLIGRQLYDWIFSRAV